jgi:hypothetical protein
MNPKSRHSLALALMFAALTFLLASCGGGGGSGGTAQATGSVALLLTDAPADEFDNIMVTVEKAELLSDDGRVTVMDETKTFDLLELTDARVFAIRNDVPAGTYSKIRLTLSRLELIKRDDDGNIIETYEPKLPGNGKLDLVPEEDFRVEPDGSLVIQIDMDASKSIHIVSAGGGTKYQFRPVVFVDIIGEPVQGNLVRLHGVIRDIDAEDGEFELCTDEIDINYEDDDQREYDGCIEVAVEEDTAIFDEGGLPTDFGDLVEGDEATVYGKFRREDDDDEDGDDVDDGHERELDDLELVASVIELGEEGTFLTLDGVALSEVDSSDQFDMEVESNQGFVPGTVLTVQLQEGTRIIDRQGNELGEGDIGSGDLVAVDGILDVNEDVLFAALIVLDLEAPDEASLSGSVDENPDGECGLSINTDTGERSVRAGNADVFLVSATDNNGGSEPIELTDLVEGQEVDVYGSEAGDGCFEADTIIAFDI